MVKFLLRFALAILAVLFTLQLSARPISANTVGKFVGTKLSISSASASSVYKTYVAANAIDDNLSTQWVASATPASLTVDLGSDQEIDGVRWYRVAVDRLPEDYTVSTSSDDVDYDTQVTVTGNSAAGYVWDAFPSTVTARYVKINVTATVGGSAPDLHEFQVHGPPVTYGDASAFNIKVAYDDEDDYRTYVYDGSTLIFRRSAKENDNISNDFSVTPAGESATSTALTWSSYSYDTDSSTLTLTTTVTASGVDYTVTDEHRFISAYNVENTVSVSTPSTSADLDYSNFFHYDSGTTTSFRSLDQAQEESSYGGGNNAGGMGFVTTIGLSTGSNVYGLVADSPANTKNLPRWRVRPDLKALSANWNDKIADHALTSSVPYSSTIWIFRSDQTLTDFRTQAVNAYAEAKGFTGSYFEKMLKVVADTLIHPSYNNDGTYVVRPAFFYGHMHMRDAFWTTMGLPKTSTYNSYTSDIMNRFTTLQRDDGRIATAVDSGDDSVGYGTFPNSLDDSTLLYILEAYYDQQTRSYSPDTTALANALAYVNDNFASNGVLIGAYGLNDIGSVASDDKTGYMQGLYAAALKAAKQMGVTGATDTLISQATTAYQNMYDSSLAYLPFTNTAGKQYKSPDVLFGEAFSWLLFGSGLLTSTQVTNTIDNQWDTGKGLASMVNSDNTYVDRASYDHGDYWNGGSWFLTDLLAYYAGVMGGTSSYMDSIKTRIETELAEDPTSHEYLQTESGLAYYGSCEVSRMAYGWNAIYLGFLPSLEAPKSLGGSDTTTGSWIGHNQPTVTFTLNDVEDDTVKYQIQIDDSSDFSSPVVDHTSALAAETSYSFTVGQAAGSGSYTTGSSGQTLADGSYYWRARQIDSNSNTTNWSTANSGGIAFKVDTTSPVQANFGLHAPANNSSVNTTLPTFVFHKATDAGSSIANYQIIVDGEVFVDTINPTAPSGTDNREDAFRRIGYEGNYFYVYSKQESKRLSSGAHTWKVRAVDGVRNERDSDTWNLTVDLSASPITLTEIGDFSGLTLSSADPSVGTYYTNSRRPTFKGSSNSGTKIQINIHSKSIEGEVTVGSDSIWSWTPSQDLDFGSHKVRITSIDEAGNESQLPEFTIIVLGGLKAEIVDQGTIEAADEVAPETSTLPNLYSVKIKVVDALGQPLSGVKVILHSTPREGITAEDGSVVFENVEPGEHKVIFAYKDQAVERDISLTGDTVEEFNFTVEIREENPFLTRPVQVVIGALVFVILSLTAVLLQKQRKSSRS